MCQKYKLVIKLNFWSTNWSSDTRVHTIKVKKTCFNFLRRFFSFRTSLCKTPSSISERIVTWRMNRHIVNLNRHTTNNNPQIWCNSDVTDSGFSSWVQSSWWVFVRAPFSCMWIRHLITTPPLIYLWTSRRLFRNNKSKFVKLGE